MEDFPDLGGLGGGEAPKPKQKGGPKYVAKKGPVNSSAWGYEEAPTKIGGIKVELA